MKEKIGGERTTSYIDKRDRDQKERERASEGLEKGKKKLYVSIYLSKVRHGQYFFVVAFLFHLFYAGPYRFVEDHLKLIKFLMCPSPRGILLFLFGV
jgi:hypothetical protein